MKAVSSLLAAILLHTSAHAEVTEMKLEDLRYRKLNSIIGFYRGPEDASTADLRRLLRDTEALVEETSPEAFGFYECDTLNETNKRLAKDMGLHFGDGSHVFVRTEFDGVHEYTGPRTPQALARYTGQSVMLGNPVDVMHVDNEQQILNMLKPDTPEEKVGAIVAFTSFSCSFCQRLRPHFEAGATFYKDFLVYAQVTCEGHGYTETSLAFCRERGVKEYPTLALRTRDAWIVYPEKDVTTGGLENWLRGIADNMMFEEEWRRTLGAAVAKPLPEGPQTFERRRSDAASRGEVYMPHEEL